MTSPPHSIHKVDFLFGAREEGESKLTGKVMVYYLLHLKELYLFRYLFFIVALVLLAVGAAVAALQ